MAKFSVLHISDLHRDPENPISNQVLLDSLERDRERYTSHNEPPIQPPNLIIVSGDIIQGIKHDTPNAEAELKKQYDEALRFLNELTNIFLEGDKQRIIIVPGNHDVSSYHFHQSINPVEIKNGAKTGLAEELFQNNSPLRWSWDNFSLYKIDNSEMYHQRFAAFVDFYQCFYEGQRSYSLQPENQFDIFEISNLEIVVIGFSSCYNNDLLNRQGAIHPDCIAYAGKHLRQLSKSREHLRIAVWHHNIEGTPTESGYMDPDIIQNFIDSGFSLGFHGHQHKPQFLDMRFRYGIERSITVISAGTLCGGAAFRHGRAYNIVELDVSEGTGRLHVREMQNDNLLMPIWATHSLALNQDCYLDFTFNPPPKPSIKINHPTTLLIKAKTLYECNKYQDAVDVLLPLASTEDLACRLLLDCLINLGDDGVAKIIEIFDPPKSVVEAIALLDALAAQNDRSRLAEVLKLPLIAASVDPAIVEIRKKYEARLKNRNDRDS